MDGIEEFASLFGSAATGVENAAASAQRVTDKTVEVEQKLINTIDEAKAGLEAYGALTLAFQGLAAFSLLYIAGKMSRKGGE